MIKRMNLRIKIFLLLAVLIGTTLTGGLLTIWYAQRVDHFFTTIMDRDVVALKAVQGLEISLVMQKGFVTYYYLDGNEKWLDQLNIYHESFQKWMDQARHTMLPEVERNVLNQIEAGYIRYTVMRNHVIDLYRNGEKEKGAALHSDVRNEFSKIYDLCEELKHTYDRALEKAKAESRSRARLINSLALGATIMVFLLGALLAYVLLRQILQPIRLLAMDGSPIKNAQMMTDEVRALQHRLHSLMKDVDLTRNQLELSQEHLLHSEKWALVGKLAAGMAHSIRNPLTSVQMRLFSLGRTLELQETEKEDLEVISEEINHIDTILQNFLEFSRPPKFTMQEASPSDVIDHAVQLLRHRLDSSGVKVEKRRENRLPTLHLDYEQLKEALVNILMNACEAMNDGGMIILREEEIGGDGEQREVSICISDNGPGIPKGIQERIFQPFFSTKGEGTGLGLSIASRIIEGHHGKIDVFSEGTGTTFTITLPVR